ncbi:pyruvate, water dikinase regulatory protein [Alkalicoccus chagannorensis]|uniref:pyruvate, water dikinase regulatory protein n=1 Tax=Alkalicoccus chagannorensis TaxID=427072 RepID=UPI00047B2F0E|nr:pyruvate, water dikinase regulatory protein [Alkalicoccus chagannorensis]
MTKKIYVLSDSVGETGDRMVQAALTQFISREISVERIPFISNTNQLYKTMEKAGKDGVIAAYTFVLPELRQEMKKLGEYYDIHTVDLLSPLLSVLGETLGESPKAEPGMIRKLDEDYFQRIEAVEFAVKYDDAQHAEEGIRQADLVLIGVSRTSKTPLSMYLAHKQWKVANVPLVPEVTVPEVLYSLPPGRCVGLTLSPQKLHEIRLTRLEAMGVGSGGRYASYERIMEEMDYAEKVMKRARCPRIDVTNRAVEETAGYILDVVQKERGIG